MTEKKDEIPKLKAKRRTNPDLVQRRASDPEQSVWVTASAGTGKTKVLTDRVLRLLLKGEDVENILCVTFTNAGASVMKNRIRDELSHWSVCSDYILNTKLKKLTGKKSDAEIKKRARQLFAQFLDVPNGIRIQTIHSFCQSILRKFPMETGIPPYFEVMDEQTSSQFLREAQADILNEVVQNPDTDLAKSVRLITPEISEEDFISLISHITYRRGQLKSIFKENGGISPTIDKIYDYLKTPIHLRGKDIKPLICSDAGYEHDAPDIGGLRQAASLLSHGTGADIDKGQFIQEWLDNPEYRFALFDQYASIFLTDSGDVKKRLTTAQSKGARDILQTEAERLLRGMEHVKTANVAYGTKSLLVLSQAILEKYEQKKQRLNMLDYDDLIYQVNRLFQDKGDMSWVLRKLDGNINHILVDEAQDTNPDQWQVVVSIAQEFFKPQPKNEEKTTRTIFVVGDEKQSIFSFQRADPQEFKNRQSFFKKLVKKAGGKWRDVDMRVTFRSTSAVTNAVDAVFADKKVADGVSLNTKTPIHHEAFRQGHGGVVELYPVMDVPASAPTKDWALPLNIETDADTKILLAEQIADKIKGWLDKGEKLNSRKRPINPSDIMILVRRRSDFVEHLIRALKQRDIPVSGADRIVLREQIVVQDLEALGKFLLSPRDDYNLACLLKSPLIGMNDADLEGIALGRDGSLWGSLKEKADTETDSIYKTASDYLKSLYEILDMENPYEFYAHILMNACPASERSGLYALYSRLGVEAEDAVVEFMNAVERFESKHTPSLQGFLSWLSVGETEIKREMSQDSKSGQVNIMTVHGAKGLESPVVILPDTTGMPSDNIKSIPKFLWPIEGRDIPLWSPRRDYENRKFEAERKKIEQEVDKEYRRLLYVAMTRAEDRLYVFGLKGRRKISPNSWYSLIYKGLSENLQNRDVNFTLNDNQDINEPLIHCSVKQEVRPKNDGVLDLKEERKVGVPTWARTSIDRDSLNEDRANSLTASQLGKFTPSNDGILKKKIEKPVENDNEEAQNKHSFFQEDFNENALDTRRTVLREIGTLTHELLELLPNTPKEHQEKTAYAYLDNANVDLSDKDRKYITLNVMRVLNAPKYKFLFGNNSKAEVNITGVINRNGVKQHLSGQIDRLVIEDDNVWIVDYKNSFKTSNTDKDLLRQNIIQMASYRHIVAKMYPDKNVKCALLWTRTGEMHVLSDTVLNKMAKNIGLEELPKLKNNLKNVK